MSLKRKPLIIWYSLGVATNTRYLTDHRITHIVSVCHEDIPAQRQDSPIQHFRIAIDDVSTADILRWLSAAVQWIGNALNNENGVVLVHSTLGQSRSAAIVAAYSMSSFVTT
jgi:dual specificity phosphatase 12